MAKLPSSGSVDLLKSSLWMYASAWKPTGKPDRSGGRSHFCRVRLLSCSKIFEPGSKSQSANFTNLRIQPLFRLGLLLMQSKFSHIFT